MIKLSKRLASIASNIDKEDKVVDIGCDHGYLSIYLKAVNGNKIVIATDEGSVTNGALNTKGIDFYELGKEAGKLAAQILKDGKSPSDLEIVTLKPTNLVFNKKTMEAIGVTLPEKLKNEVKFVD